jgi:hypothetical protein
MEGSVGHLIARTGQAGVLVKAPQRVLPAVSSETEDSGAGPHVYPGNEMDEPSRKGAHIGAPSQNTFEMILNGNREP